MLAAETRCVYYTRKVHSLRTHRIRVTHLGLILALWLFAAPIATAASILEYDLTGKAGTEVSDPATAVAAGLVGNNLIRGSDLTPSAASNGFSASGWDNL